MLLFGDNWKSHRPWAWLFLLGTLGLGVWFFLAGHGQAEWPGGSSMVGLICGLVGGAIILFEFALWLRKKVRVWRLGKAQSWLRAHIWLGLLSVPVLVFHSGLRLGGPLSAVLLILLLIVVASGLLGLWLQSLLPRRLLEEFPAEQIAGHIARRCVELEKEAERIVTVVCGLGPAGKEKDEEEGAFLQLGGAKQAAAAVKLPPGIAGAEPLARFFTDTAQPFLRQGSRANSLLSHVGGAASMFDHLRAQLPPDAHGPASLLEDLCTQRRQLDQQSRLHTLLHCWLWLHFPLSVALVLLMFLHIFVAFKYY